MATTLTPPDYKILVCEGPCNFPNIQLFEQRVSRAPRIPVGENKWGTTVETRDLDAFTSALGRSLRYTLHTGDGTRYTCNTCGNPRRFGGRR